MKKRLLFRGKIIPDKNGAISQEFENEWVIGNIYDCGNLYKSCRQHAGCYENNCINRGQCPKSHNRDVTSWVSMQHVRQDDRGGWRGYVHGQTLGQYTGTTDKNGVKIFEGDILKIKNDYIIVSWSRSKGAFRFRHQSNNETSYLYDAEEKYEIFWEVVGNVYDNPELLKGAEE